MQYLKRLRASRSRSLFARMPFNLHSRQHLVEFTRLLEFSNTPQVSIHFEILGETPQTITLHCPEPQLPPVDLESQAPSSAEVPTSSQAVSGASAFSGSQIPSETAIEHNEVGADNLYAIASYTKILINIAFARLLCHERYKHLDLSWDKSACDVFNNFRERQGKSRIQRLWGNPEIRQLLLHKNGFAPMNRYLFAPDGTFIMTQDEFIRAAPLITEDYYKDTYPHRGWVEYSNGNHIFAGMILEEVTGRKLQDLMHELVFDWLDMTHTILDEQSLASRALEAVLVPGYRVSANKDRTAVASSRYLSDVVEVASLGARSSTEDMARLNRAFLGGTEGQLGSKFQRHEMADFFRPSLMLPDGGSATLGGSFSALDSLIPGGESLHRVLIPADSFSPYTLGKRPNGSRCNVYHKAGSIDGFSSSTYLLLKDRAFVVVLGNSSGPLDVTDHIARYIIQEAFRLSPRANIVDSAIKEGLIASKRLQDLESDDLGLSKSSDNVEDLAGTYQHVRYLQQLTITHDGAVTIHGTTKTSSPMKLVRMSSKVVRILPGNNGFAIERWSVWDNLEFEVEFEPNRGICLVGNGGVDRYQRS
jgi:CubicO group peptidase (beta-lactamase class C family)